MPRTPQEQLDWELQCYGCTSDDLKAYVEGSIGGPQMMAMSILSDAQEHLHMATNMNGDNSGHIETARQFMNRAKYIIAELLTKKEES